MSRLGELFSENGVLEKTIEGFHFRPQQQEMAEAVTRTLEEGGVLVCEAGTGTGKTFAYLLPALVLGAGAWRLRRRAAFWPKLLLGGALGDHYGRKKILVIGTALFGAASLLCALVPTLEALILGLEVRRALGRPPHPELRRRLAVLLREGLP